MTETTMPPNRRSDMHWFLPEDLRVVGVDTKADDEHPLYRAPERFAIDPGLVANIAAHGVLENVLCRRNGDAVEVVAGVRRTLHARAVNARLAAAGEPRLQIPVTLKRISDDEAMLLIAAENSGRLDDQPIEQAQMIQRLLSRRHKLHVIAAAFAMSVDTARKRLRLLDLDATILARVRDGALAPTTAITVADLPPAKQVAELERLAVAGATAQAAAAAKRTRVVGAGRKLTHGGGLFPRMQSQIAQRVFDLRNRTVAKPLPPGFFDGLGVAFGLIDPAKIEGLEPLLTTAKSKQPKRKRQRERR